MAPLVDSFLALRFTLLVVTQSFHHISIAPSEEKSLSSGPSTLSRRSQRVDVYSLVHLSVLITFSVEKILSTRQLQNGKLTDQENVWAFARIR